MAAGAVMLVLGACGSPRQASPPVTSPQSIPTESPRQAGLALADAARAAAREDNYKVSYRRISGRELGMHTFARSGEMTSDRFVSTSGPDQQEVFIREGGGPDIFCLNSAGSWYCEEGSDPDAPRGAPIFVSPKSLDGFAAQSATISGEQMRITTQEIAGTSATCYDLPPIPRDGLEGRDPFAPDPDIFTDLLDLGGSVCFGANKLLKLAVLGDPPLTFDGVEIGTATASDFEPPAKPLKIEPREARPTVVQGS